MNGAPLPFERCVATACDGSDVAYGGYGIRGGRTVVLLHGWCATGDVFRPLLRRFRPGTRVLVPELRGHGRSRHLSADSTIERLARDLERILAHEHVERCTLVGHSMGGAVAWEYCSLFGTDLVERLCIVDMTPRVETDAEWPHGPFGDWSRGRIREFLDLLGASFTDGFVAYLSYALQRRRLPDALRAEADRLLRHVDPETLARLYADLATRDYRMVQRSLTVPSLFLFAGDSEFYGRAAAEAIAGLNPRSALEIYPGCTHFLFLEKPDRFVEALDGSGSGPVLLPEAANVVCSPERGVHRPA